jgi:hypothetical protein
MSGEVLEVGEKGRKADQNGCGGVLGGIGRNHLLESGNRAGRTRGAP